MSTSCTVFVAHDCAFLDVIAIVQDFIGRPLDVIEEPDDTTYGCSLMGVRITVYRAKDFEDDQGIHFADYGPVIDVTRFGGVFPASLLSDLCRIIALILAHTIWREK